MGNLCVIDTNKRTLTAQNCAALKALSKQVSISGHKFIPYARDVTLHTGTHTQSIICVLMQPQTMSQLELRKKARILASSVKQLNETQVELRLAKEAAERQATARSQFLAK